MLARLLVLDGRPHQLDSSSNACATLCDLDSSSVYHPMSTDAELKAFIARQHQLLDREREAEIERTSLLLSNCPPKLLEDRKSVV